LALGPLDIQQAMAEIDSGFADTTADEARETTGMETDAMVHFALPRTSRSTATRACWRWNGSPSGLTLLGL